MGKRKLPFESESLAKVSKLSAFGFGTPSKEITSSRSSANTPLKEIPHESKNPPKTPTFEQRSFKESWKFGRPWLRYDPSKKAMFCDICIKAQVCNTFTTGCTKLKKESVTKHTEGKGNNSHAKAIDCQKHAHQMDVARESAVSKSKNAIVSALRNVFFAALNDIPNATICKLNDLCIEQGATQLNDLKVDGHASYTHHQSISDFQAALAKVLEDRLLEKVEKSGLFSIMIDESTDVSVHQNLVVYIRILEEEGARWVPKSYFLGVRQMSSASAESITSEVLDVLASKGLDLGNLVGIATDGAAVMVGCRSGVTTRLKEVCPGLLSTHCIAHRLALGCGKGADQVRYLIKFQEILNSIFKFFNNSPKHMASLEGIQAILDGVGQGRFKEVFHTRWLSFEGSVHAVVRNYSALLSVFLEENSAKALSMHKPVSTYKFLYCAHFLSDVLKQLSILCKMYQKSDLDFSDVHPLLCSTISVLEELRDSKSGSVLGEFVKVVPAEPRLGDNGVCTFQFQGHTIRDSIQQRSEAVSACESFVSHTVDSLKDRFSEKGDSEVMSAMSALLDPMLESEVSCKDLKVVVHYLGKCGVKDSSCLEQEIVGFRGYVKAQVARSNQSVKSVTDVAQLGLKCSDIFPVVGMLCKRLLVLPVSTVDCERGFSRQNLVKTCLRNRISIHSLEHLLRISIDGQQQPMDYDLAFRVWATAKPRRILK